MSDPTKDTFRDMLLEARIEEAVRTRASLGGLDGRLDRVEARWEEEALRETVAAILADALREAGHRDRDALIRAIAPNILSTVRKEIGSAHPEIIEALSPRIGELIRAAVAKAIAGLQRQIDEAVPLDLWLASLRAALTGTSASGWLLKGEGSFRVIEAFLIERGSGLILAQDRPGGEEGEEASALDDDLMAGMIAALDSFARDAFGGDGIDELRQLTLSAGTIYLRASPTKILALRCTGTAPPKVEEKIDRLLDRVIRRLREEGSDAVPARLLAIEADEEDEARGGGSGAGALVGKAVLVLIGVLGLFWVHGALEEANRERWREAALAAVRDDPAMTGYPVSATLEDGTVTLTGLVPDAGARASIAARLDALALPVEVVLAMPEAGRRLDP